MPLDVSDMVPGPHPTTWSPISTVTELVSPLRPMYQCGHSNSELKEKVSPQSLMASFLVLSPYHCLSPLVTHTLRKRRKALEPLVGDRSALLHSCSQALPAFSAAQEDPGTQQRTWSSTHSLTPEKSPVRTSLLRGSSDVLN